MSHKCSEIHFIMLIPVNRSPHLNFGSPSKSPGHEQETSPSFTSQFAFTPHGIVRQGSKDQKNCLTISKNI